jgi:hypothetical protein
MQMATKQLLQTTSTMKIPKIVFLLIACRSNSGQSFKNQVFDSSQFQQKIQASISYTAEAKIFNLQLNLFNIIDFTSFFPGFKILNVQRTPKIITSHNNGIYCV